MGERTWSWTAIQEAHANTRVPVAVAMDTAAASEAYRLGREYDRLKAEDDAGRVDHSTTLVRLRDQIRELEAHAQESEVTFVFEGLGRSRYALLIAEHPRPKDGQQDDPVVPDARWNTETFPPALLSASCVAPTDLAGNDEAWREIHDTWSAGIVARLWRACIAANQGVNETPKSVVVSEVRERGSSVRS